VAVLLRFGSTPADAQPPACRVLCSPEFSVEPTITSSVFLGSPRIMDPDGRVSRQARETGFELIVSVGLPTRLRWLELTVEAIVFPFDSGVGPELELEANLVWLPSKRTGGWVSSHLDVVDKYSPAERAADGRAYTHKLNFELDTSVALFNRVRESRWLRGVELELSLDYVATGLPRAGDTVDGRRYLDDASPWSLSLVLVLPLAPM
jgi:hypothetical protein